MLVALFQINPKVVRVSVWRFYRDGLIQAEREILREVEMQFFHTHELGMRTEMNTFCHDVLVKGRGRDDHR
jgi:hypothetical protein